MRLRELVRHPPESAAPEEEVLLFTRVILQVIEFGPRRLDSFQGPSTKAEVRQPNSPSDRRFSR